MCTAIAKMEWWVFTHDKVVDFPKSGHNMCGENPVLA